MTAEEASVTGVTESVTVRQPSRSPSRTVTPSTNMLVRPSRHPSRTVTPQVTVTNPLSHKEGFVRDGSTRCSGSANNDGFHCHNDGLHCLHPGHHRVDACVVEAMHTRSPSAALTPLVVVPTLVLNRSADGEHAGQWGCPESLSAACQRATRLVSR
jgi:hypothetical protein